MSDPVTNAEMEDVLSSIRKLVSQDDGAAKPVPSARQALVLTDEQRIEARETTEPALSEGAKTRAANSARTELERAIEELEETMGLSEDPVSDAAEIDRDAPVGKATDGPSLTAQPTGDKAVLDSLQLVSHAAKSGAQAYEGDVPPGAELSFEEDGAPTRNSEARPAPYLLSVPSEPAPEAAPDAPVDADFSAVDAQPSVSMTFDEDQLREFVSEIVRRELQGELGERITRNVRKLVRREINRALAGQDLI